MIFYHPLFSQLQSFEFLFQLHTYCILVKYLPSSCCMIWENPKRKTFKRINNVLIIVKNLTLNHCLIISFSYCLKGLYTTLKHARLITETLILLNYRIDLHCLQFEQFPPYCMKGHRVTNSALSCKKNKHRPFLLSIRESLLDPQCCSYLHCSYVQMP